MLSILIVAEQNKKKNTSKSPPMFIRDKRFLFFFVKPVLKTQKNSSTLFAIQSQLISLLNKVVVVIGAVGGRKALDAN